jgi:hypothetical protein
MRSIDERIWVHEEPLRFHGLQVGRRMVVVRLRDGALWLNSPAPLGAYLKAELDRLGEVRFVTPASTLHGHLFMEQYASAYPRAELLAVPGLARKRPELEFAGVLGDEPDPRWGGEIDQAVFRGIRRIIDLEVEFLHRPSRTLILADLGFHIGDGWPLLTRAFARIAGVRNRLAPTPDFRLAVRDREAAGQSLERILSWDFDRVIVGHGDIVEVGGREAFERGVVRALAPRKL